MKEFTVEVLVFEAQPVKLEFVHHCTEYGVELRPDPESEDALQLQVGVVSLVGDVVDGVPGVSGAVVST